MKDRKACNETHFGSKIPRIVNENMVCAMDNGRNVCNGDSGGPLICMENGHPVVVGVTSFGVRCEDNDFPGVQPQPFMVCILSFET